MPPPQVRWHAATNALACGRFADARAQLVPLLVEAKESPEHETFDDTSAAASAQQLESLQEVKRQTEEWLLTGQYPDEIRKPLRESFGRTQDRYEYQMYNLVAARLCHVPFRSAVVGLWR